MIIRCFVSDFSAALDRESVCVCVCVCVCVGSTWRESVASMIYLNSSVLLVFPLWRNLELEMNDPVTSGVQLEPSMIRKTTVTYCHALGLTTLAVWIGNRICWTLPALNYNSLLRYRQFRRSTFHCRRDWVFSVCSFFTSPMVTTSTGRRSFVSAFPDCPRASATTTLDSEWTQLKLDSSNRVQ
jgi:hypothetical protein